MSERADEVTTLREIKEVDDAESRSIGDLSRGIIREQPWVWLQPSLKAGRYVPHISVGGAFEIFRRLSAQTPLTIENFSAEFIDSKQGIPVVSVIVVVKEVGGQGRQSLGGQDSFLTISASNEEELRAHGTAQALHKALRNAILNFIQLYMEDAEKFLNDFIKEAVEKGRAAIIERGGKIVPLKEVSVTEPPQEKVKMETTSADKDSSPQNKILAELEEISPEHWQYYLLVYSEILQKDPSIFTEKDWSDFVRWCKTTITQPEIEDLLKLATDHAHKNKVDISDRKELFRYLFKYIQGVEHVTKGRRITELTQPEYRLVRQQMISDLMSSLSVDDNNQENLDDSNLTNDIDEFPF